MIFVDDFTRMICITFLKEKYEYFEKFMIYKNRGENKLGIKCLRSDRGGELTSREFKIFL